MVGLFLRYGGSSQAVREIIGIGTLSCLLVIALVVLSRVNLGDKRSSECSQLRLTKAERPRVLFLLLTSSALRSLQHTPPWVSVALFTALLCAVMPSSVISGCSAKTGLQTQRWTLSVQSRVSDRVGRRSTTPGSCDDRDSGRCRGRSVFVRLVEILLMGFVTNASTALCDARISPSRVLSVVAVTSLFMLAFRVLLLAFVTFASALTKRSVRSGLAWL